MLCDRRKNPLVIIYKESYAVKYTIEENPGTNPKSTN